jgi:DNA modification methylase
MNTDIKAIPLKKLPLGDMLTGHASESIAALLQTAREDRTSTRHLCIQGDASDALHLLPNASVELMHLSPPYETEVDYGGPESKELAAAELGSEGSEGEHKDRLTGMFQTAATKLKPNGTMVLVTANSRVGGRGQPGPNGYKSNNRRTGMSWKGRKPKSLIRLTDIMTEAAEAAGLFLRHIEIWQKPYCKPERVTDRSRQTHEYVLIFQKTGASKCVRQWLTAAGLPNDSSVFSCPVSQASYGHPATFNPLLAERYVLAMTKPGDVVLDFMGGVGSTALAAMKHGRHSITIELYPKFCRKAQERLAHFSEDFKAGVYVPARFDVFAAQPSRECIQVSPVDSFRPKASDVRFMYNYRAVPRPELLKDILSAEDPQPLEPFPVECLTDFQKALLEDLVLASEANEAVAATCLLTTWSAAIAGSWQAFDPKKSAVDHPNLQSLVVAPSGSGKSIAFTANKPVSYFNQAIARNARLRRWKTQPSLTCDCATGPALVEQLIESQHTTFLFSPEAGGLLADIIAGAKGGGGNIFDLLLKGFSVEATDKRTRKDGRHDFTPNIAMLLLAQPDLVKELMENKLFKARGLANRWLIVEIPEPAAAYDNGIYFDPDPCVHQLWHRRVRQALYLRLLGRKSPRRHTWTDAAKEVFRMRHNQMVKRINKDWKPFGKLLRRSRELHKRITLGLLAAEFYNGNERVLLDDEDIALRASLIMDWFDQRRIEFFSTSLQETMEQRKLRVMEILLENLEHSMTLRDMERVHGVAKSVQKAVCSAYPKLFEQKTIKPDGPGRPSKVIRLRWSR